MSAKYWHYRKGYMDSITKREADKLLSDAAARLSPGAPSAINAALTNAQALDILRNGIAAYGPDDALRPLVARNIQRVCR